MNVKEIKSCSTRLACSWYSLTIRFCSLRSMLVYGWRSVRKNRVRIETMSEQWSRRQVSIKLTFSSYEFLNINDLIWKLRFVIFYIHLCVTQLNTSHAYIYDQLFNEFVSWLYRRRSTERSFLNTNWNWDSFYVPHNNSFSRSTF